LRSSDIGLAGECRYVRYERAMLDQSELFQRADLGASYYRSALGVRFDINAKSSIKFEIAHYPQHG